MRHLAAYLLLVAGGNATPTAADVTALLAQAGIEVNAERLSQLMGDLEGKDIAEIIAAGKEKLMVAGVAAAAPAAAAAGAAPAAEAPQVEKAKVEEVDALDGGMDMFGGGGGGGDY
uniref:60S acidic ribosomal protein P2 n=1 Tax=Coccolithus braarudii TaxID=221442 RepID=A0A7S0L6F8_9EUKA|mmetsp:Transcript_29737/g.74781  ORF Transcript_29737/g.74781 Transcript_29737/m.74781 type:complete len:116 (+) Transcript_29737:44-391(+)